MWKRRGRAAVAEADAAWGVEQQAADYERGRPTYPRPVIDLLVTEIPIHRGTRVCDLGAGTGQLTRALLAEAADVVAVEPVLAMRERLQQACPEADVRDGSAERLPLEDGSVDVVTVAQAFHWFDAGRALAEIHRVLRPGGTLALMWNLRDTSVDWVAEFGNIVHRHSGGKPRGGGRRGDWAGVIGTWGGYGHVHEARIPHTVSHNTRTLLARAVSTSHVATLSPRRRARCLRAVQKLTERHPALAGKDTFDLPHETVVYWCRRA